MVAILVVIIIILRRGVRVKRKRKSERKRNRARPMREQNPAHLTDEREGGGADCSAGGGGGVYGDGAPREQRYRSRVVSVLVLKDLNTGDKRHKDARNKLHEGRKKQRNRRETD